MIEDYLTREKPHPRGVIRATVRGLWETACAVTWAACLAGAIVWSEYFGACFCGHDAFRHERVWPRKCRDCPCTNLRR